MSRPIITIYDCETNETVVREMNNAEFAQYEKDVATAETFKTESEAKASAKSALLTQLGITEEQAKLLLS